MTRHIATATCMFAHVHLKFTLATIEFLTSTQDSSVHQPDKPFNVCLWHTACLLKGSHHQKQWFTSKEINEKEQTAVAHWSESPFTKTAADGRKQNSFFNSTSLIEAKILWNGASQKNCRNNPESSKHNRTWKKHFQSSRPCNQCFLLLTMGSGWASWQQLLQHWLIIGQFVTQCDWLPHCTATSFSLSVSKTCVQFSCFMRWSCTCFMTFLCLADMMLSLFTSMCALFVKKELKNKKCACVHFWMNWTLCCTMDHFLSFGTEQTWLNLES